MAQPIDVAQATLFLAPSESSYITAFDLIDDGGLYMVQRTGQSRVGGDFAR